MPITKPGDLQLVTDAVARAEAATAGEIVPVIAPASDGYSDVALVWAAAIAFTAMSALALFPQFYMDLWDRTFLDGWNHQWTPGEIASLVLGLGFLKFVSVWAILALWPGLRMLLVPGPLRTMRVHAAAVRHFKVGAERRTHGRTGVLLYVSLAEHRAEIVADEAIATLVPAEVWGMAMADMLAEIRHGRIAEGLAAGVRDVGAVLAEHFPRTEDDRNELPDRLIVL